MDESVVPSCVYTSPEVASVGLTADEAKAAGIAVRCSKQLTGANGRSLVEESEAGYVKLVCDEATGRVLGAQLVCPRATDLVAEVARLAPWALDTLHESGDLERLVRAQLEPFYSCAEVADLLR